MIQPITNQPPNKTSMRTVVILDVNSNKMVAQIPIAKKAKLPSPKQSGKPNR